MTETEPENRSPLIVGLGGALRPGSSTEMALRVALGVLEAKGARTLLLDGSALDLPLYAPHLSERDEKAHALVAALRRADGVILASPGYHGALSGLVKNAIDYVQDMSEDAEPYLENRAVGCIATAAGWQAAVTTLASLRTITHALRGWPTPLGLAINTADPVFGPGGECLDPRVQEAIETMAGQMIDFAGRFRDRPIPPPPC